MQATAAKCVTLIPHCLQASILAKVPFDAITVAVLPLLAVTV
jgi:hypothetical protein